MLEYCFNYGSLGETGKGQMVLTADFVLKVFASANRQKVDLVTGGQLKSPYLLRGIEITEEAIKADFRPILVERER